LKAENLSNKKINFQYSDEQSTIIEPKETINQIVELEKFNLKSYLDLITTLSTTTTRNNLLSPDNLLNYLNEIITVNYSIIDDDSSSKEKNIIKIKFKNVDKLIGGENILFKSGVQFESTKFQRHHQTTPNENEEILNKYSLAIFALNKFASNINDHKFGLSIKVKNKKGFKLLSNSYNWIIKVKMLKQNHHLHHICNVNFNFISNLKEFGLNSSWFKHLQFILSEIDLKTIQSDESLFVLEIELFSLVDMPQNDGDSKSNKLLKWSFSYNFSTQQFSYLLTD
jgi:hypothetical protein